jgi:hypothetical protein
LETKLEEIEVDLRIANARAELAIGLIRTMIDQLQGIISWSPNDLFQQHFEKVDFSDPATAFACIEYVGGGHEEVPLGQAYEEDLHQRVELRKRILSRIRHEQDHPSSADKGSS